MPTIELNETSQSVADTIPVSDPPPPKRQARKAWDWKAVAQFAAIPTVAIAFATLLQTRSSSSSDLAIKAEQLELQRRVEEAKLVLMAIPQMRCSAPAEQKLMALEAMARSAPGYVGSLRALAYQCPTPVRPEVGRMINRIVERAETEDVRRSFAWALDLARQYAANRQYREAVRMYHIARDRLPSAVSEKVDPMKLADAVLEAAKEEVTGPFKTAVDLFEMAFQKVHSE